jgi:hypothetical protein
MLQAKLYNNKNEIEKLNKLAAELAKKQMLYSNFTNNETMFGGDLMFSSQMYRAGNATELYKNSVGNNFPVYNISDCQEILKNYYNITNEDKLIYMTTNLDSSLNTDNVNKYSFAVYNSITNEKLDLKLCNSITQHVMMPLTNSSQYNLTEYKQMKTQGIDMYNRNDPYFNDRCSNFIDNTTGADVSINMRRQKFNKQKAPQCMGTNCTYNGINSDNYVNCTCSSEDEASLFNTPYQYVLNSYSKFNIDIFVCINTIPVKFE